MENIFLHHTGCISKREKKITGRKSGDVLKLLGNHIELDEKFTLGSFFMMIDRHPDLHLLSEILPSLHGIIMETIPTGSKARELESLLFYKTIEIRGFPGSPSLNFYNTLKGIARQKTTDLKFFHPETLVEHTLRLGKLKHVIFGDMEDVFQYETFYTLFELVEGIAWELSFNFNPLQCTIRR